jgi:OmcA/MtrC family decaheme c-type cytochrome
MRPRLLGLSALLATLLLGSLLADSPRRRVDSDTGPTARREGNVQVVAAPSRTAPSHYSPLAKEAYLSEDLIGYIRPGLKITVNSVTIGADRKPVVDFSLTDDGLQPIDRLGNVTPGVVSISFVLASYDPAPRQYTAYTVRTQTSPITGVAAVQAAADSGGAFTDLGLGHSKYTFKTVLPAGFDQTKTHTLGIYSTRNLTDILGKNYYANVETDFRPDGGAVTATWQAMHIEKSCNLCHDPLAAHGGSRRDVKLCVLCHQPQTTDPDTGNTVDFKVMIHKIHRGSSLPSVKAGTPYKIIGNAQSINDFSTVEFPQDIRNCDTCHESTAAEASIWYTRPSSKACASCHDDVNFVTGANHPAGPATDATCSTCHVPVGEREFDASIIGAHTVPYLSKQLAGLSATIVSVDQVGAGKNPVVTFKLTNGDGSAVDPKPFGSSLNLLMGGPTTDYDRQPFRENASGATFNGTVSVYTFTNSLPANATGTWAFSIEARRTVTLDKGGPHEQTFTEGAKNPVTYKAVTGNVVARRTIVDQAKCEKCHDRLSLHGGQRLNVEECLICHNPNGDDSSRRPATAGKPESISFKRMIHRIHTGEDLAQDFTIYGFGGSVNNFNEVRFPGDRRDCVACHTSTATYELPTGGALDTVTQRDFYTPQGPGTAACLGCHDNRDAAAHAFINTAPFGEACATCHGTGKDWDVAKEHAR